MGRKKNLKSLFESAAFDPARCAHLAVDVQRDFCRGAEETAEHIVQNIAPAFSALGVPTYWIWFTDKEKSPDSAYGGLLSSGRAGDRLVGKNCMSAFDGSNIDELLTQDGKNILFMSGFYAHLCLYGTAHDALQTGRYEVVTMKDCTNAEDYSALYLLGQDGGITAASDDCLPLLEEKVRRFSPRLPPPSHGPAFR